MDWKTCYWDGYWVCFGDEDLPLGHNNDQLLIVDDTPDETTGGGQRTVPLPDNLRDKLSKLLEEGDCGSFASKLIDQAAKTAGRPSYSNDILTLFDKISGPGGGGVVFSQGPLVVGGTPANGTVRGDIGNIGNSSLTPPTVVLNQLTAHSEFSYQQTFNYGYAFTALHEIIHLAGAGTYTDRDLAQAVFDLGGLSEKEKKRFDKLKRDDIEGNSGFWNDFLKNHCP